MPSTDRKLELKAKTSVAQTDSQPYVYAKGLKSSVSITRVAKSCGCHITAYDIWFFRYDNKERKSYEIFHHPSRSVHCEAVPLVRSPSYSHKTTMQPISVSVSL
jgi:hypothetical protein